jgi:hypothetical protein
VLLIFIKKIIHVVKCLLNLNFDQLVVIIKKRTVMKLRVVMKMRAILFLSHAKWMG